MSVSDYWDGYYSRLPVTADTLEWLRCCHDCGAVVHVDDMGTHRSWHRNQEEFDD